jgi:shikimate kinase
MGTASSQLANRKNPIMANTNDATTISQSSVDRFARIMERIGLAIMGALCGLFVAAFVAKANFGEINSLGALFSAILYGSLGFYFGTNIPGLSSGASRRSLFGTGPGPIALASAIGTFVAAAAALVSVYMIIFDETPAAIWNVGIGLGWVLGVLLQLGAGTVARLRKVTRATG